MRPTDYQLATYPYRAEAPYVDVFAPMVYWSCNEPGALAAQSLRPLVKLRPVHLIGQSYDMADEGGNVTSVKAMIFAKAGKEREAEETIQRAIDIGKGFTHFHHTTFNIASAYALLNKPDQAIKWLQFTADDGFPCYPLFDNDANLNSLRKDERFIAFMAKLKQQWEHYQATL